MSNSLQLYSNLLQGKFRVIDKADVRVGRIVPFTKPFQEVYEASMRGAKRPWTSSRYFASTADLRAFGYDVRLHMYSTLTPEPIHKLEIYDTGGKTLDEMRTLIASFFDTNPDTLGLMRVDLCADIFGVDVGWFKRHTIIQSKQTNREFGGVAPYMTIRKGRAETLYAGAKPNQYRFYNKSVERMVRYRWYVRQLARNAPGLATITRAERQLAGRDLQRMELARFESLKNAPALFPFEKVVFYAAGGEPSIEEHGYFLWTSGMFIRQMVRDHGLAATRGWLREKLGRNLYREWKHVEPFLNVPEIVRGISQGELRQSYQRSALKQIEGSKGVPHDRGRDLHPRIQP